MKRSYRLAHENRLAFVTTAKEREELKNPTLCETESAFLEALLGHGLSVSCQRNKDKDEIHEGHRLPITSYAYTFQVSKDGKPLTLCQNDYSCGEGIVSSRQLPIFGKISQAQWQEYRAHKDAIADVYRPNLSAIFSALFCDASCGYADFQEFCDNFGLDTDSRKAEQNHRACMQTRLDLLDLFGSEEYERLAELANEI